VVTVRGRTHDSASGFRQPAAVLIEREEEGGNHTVPRGWCDRSFCQVEPERLCARPADREEVGDIQDAGAEVARIEAADSGRAR